MRPSSISLVSLQLVEPPGDWPTLRANIPGSVVSDQLTALLGTLACGLGCALPSACGQLPSHATIAWLTRQGAHSRVQAVFRAEATCDATVRLTADLADWSLA